MVDRVVVYGVSRCGTTLVWRVFRGLLPAHVVVNKSHWECVDAPCTMVYRDFRDALASNYRVNGLSLPGLWDPPKPMSREILDKYLHEYMERHWPILQWYLSRHPEAPVLRYEEFYADHMKIVHAVEQAAECTFDADTIVSVLHDVSLPAARKTIENLPDFRSKDNTTHLHGRHVGPVTPGTWREWVRDEDVEYMLERLHPALSALGYGGEDDGND